MDNACCHGNYRPPAKRCRRLRHSLRSSLWQQLEYIHTVHLLLEGVFLVIDTDNFFLDDMAQ